MNKIQFESEEQLDAFTSETFPGLFYDNIEFMKIFKDYVHQKGYIKKTDLEIAEEKYYKNPNGINDSSVIDYVCELEKEIERLNNEGK